MTTAVFKHYFKCVCGRLIGLETSHQRKCDCGAAHVMLHDHQHFVEKPYDILYDEHSETKRVRYHCWSTSKQRWVSSYEGALDG